MSADQPRKLLLLTTAGGGIGGTELMAVGLARQFVARGWAVRNIFPQTPQSDSLLAQCAVQRVPAETSAAIRAVQHKRTLRDILALRSLVRRSKPDVINLHYGVSHIGFKDVLAVRLAGRSRCVVTVHHPIPLESNRTRVMTRLGGLLSHAVVVNSHATRGVLLEAGVPAHKIRVILCGVPVPLKLPTRAEARARLGLAPDLFVVSTLARLVPEKAIGDLIEAAAHVSDPHSALRLVIAGDGPQRPTLEALATAQLGQRALFLGHVPDTADLYAAADVFALPSHMEGFGLVYVEAAFHGVPSIGTDVGGVPDAIADEETGLLVPPGDIPTLTKAIARLRDDPDLRRRLGDAARARAHREFTESRMADQYVKVFE